nr:acetyl-CoA carboxylase biotin carboxyl carrier protein subunit [Desulfobacterales bacterium]
AAPAPAADTEGTPLTAPMPGMIVKYEKAVGDSVAKGDTVLILEAMKMENALAAPVGGTIKAINYSSGDSVAKNAVLAIIG